jgi:hypothetical protein
MTDFFVGFVIPVLVFFLVTLGIVTVMGIAMGTAALLDRLAAYIVKRWWKHGKR